jgi:hypothetical protein
MWIKMFLLMGVITMMIAQVNAASINLGPQLGYYKAQDADNGAFIGGVTCRLKFTSVLGAEASINYRQETYGHDAVTVRSWPVMATGLIYPIPFVYGAMGAGWYNLTFDYNQNKYPDLNLIDETTQKFGWHFSVGAELPVGPIFKLTGDIRYVFLNYKFQEMPGSANLKSDFYVITVGFLFGL